MIYARISRDDDDERTGVDRQERDCRKYAAQHGWEVVETIIDNDLSASRYARRKRPGYQRVLSMLEAGTVDTLLCYHGDRLHRQPKELEGLIDLAENRDVLVATLYGDLDLNGSDGRANARIMVTMSAKEADNTSRRMRTFKNDRAENGKPAGGSRAFGYQPDGLTIVDSEADLIRDAVTRVLAGETMSAVCRDWNEAGLRTSRTGARWGVPSLRYVLTNPRYAALRVHQGEVVGDAAWPAILERDQHEAIVAMLSDPSRRHRNPPRAGLLTPLVKCGTCGGTMRRSGLRNGTLYRCHAQPETDQCGRVLIKAEPIERWITEAVIARLDSAAFRRAQRRKPATAGPAKALRAAEARSDALAASWATGEISKRAWLTASKALDDQIESLRRGVAASASSGALDGIGADVAAWFDALTLDRRRAVIASLIETITVKPSTSKLASDPDVNRLKVKWRV